MEGRTNFKPEIDFRQYDRVWERVLPLIDPWGTGEADKDMTPSADTMPSIANDTPSAVNHMPSAANDTPPSANTMPSIANDTPPSANTMPSAANDTPPSADTMPSIANDTPPVMDGETIAGRESASGRKTEAEILADFIDLELSERRRLSALVRKCPAWGKQTFRELAGASGKRAKRLSAFYYLLTGESYAPAVCVDRTDTARWLPDLRERCHAAARAAPRYARLAEETANPCLRRLWEEMSAAACQDAAALIRLLERAVMV